MATVLDKKYTKNDEPLPILKAIIKLAADKQGRIMKDDDIEWKQIKLTEIARLARILKAKIQ